MFDTDTLSNTFPPNVTSSSLSLPSPSFGWVWEHLKYLMIFVGQDRTGTVLYDQNYVFQETLKCFIKFSFMLSDILCWAKGSNRGVPK